MVGAAGFEPTTPCPPDKCATKLRYAPTFARKQVTVRGRGYRRAKGWRQSLLSEISHRSPRPNRQQASALVQILGEFQQDQIMAAGHLGIRMNIGH